MRPWRRRRPHVHRAAAKAVQSAQSKSNEMDGWILIRPNGSSSAVMVVVVIFIVFVAAAVVHVFVVSTLTSPSPSSWLADNQQKEPKSRRRPLLNLSATLSSSWMRQSHKTLANSRTIMMTLSLLPQQRLFSTTTTLGLFVLMHILFT